MGTDIIESKEGYLELEGLKSGVVYDASQEDPRRIKADFTTLPAKYFGACDEFIAGFLGRTFTGPKTPDRVGPYVLGERARQQANNQI